jgi:hypothetical protein
MNPTRIVAVRMGPLFTVPSTVKNLIVFVVERVTGLRYTVLEVVGADPSVV